MSNYQQKFCEKHKQTYADFLDSCPICVGEQMAEEIKKIYEEEGRSGKTTFHLPKQMEDDAKKIRKEEDANTK